MFSSAQSDAVLTSTSGQSATLDTMFGPGRSQALNLARPSSASHQDSCPPHGAKAICGARPRMEDAFTTMPYLLEIPRQLPIQELVPPRLVQHIPSASGRLFDNSNGAAEHSPLARLLPSFQPNSQASTDGSLPLTPEMDTLHFFGVFDGHGGAEAAHHCASTLHKALHEALIPRSCMPDPRRLSSTTAPVDMPRSSQRSDGAIMQPNSSLNPVPPALESKSDASLSATASDSPASLSLDRGGGVAVGHPHGVVRPPVSASAFEAAFTQAFIRVDEELGKATDAAQVGSTAVVALVGARQLYIGNCGTF